MSLPTPYYEQDGITLFCGDCREILPLLEPGSVVITDPPYGFAAYQTDIAPAHDTLAGLVKASKTCALFGYPENLVAFCVKARVVPLEWVTWAPPKQQRSNTVLLPRTSEHIAIFGEISGAKLVMRPRAQHTWGRKIARQRGLSEDECRDGDVWRDASPGVACNAHLRVHPNEKPVGLMKKLVILCSRQKDTIIDPFAGSGTTLVAAKQLGRRAIGIEIEERYCEIAVRRLAQGCLELAG